MKEAEKIAKNPVEEDSAVNEISASQVSYRDWESNPRPPGHRFPPLSRLSQCPLRLLKRSLRRSPRR